MEDNKIYMVVSNFQVEGYGEEHKNERAFSTIDKANEYAESFTDTNNTEKLANIICSFKEITK